MNGIDGFETVSRDSLKYSPGSESDCAEDQFDRRATNVFLYGISPHEED